MSYEKRKVRGEERPDNQQRKAEDAMKYDELENKRDMRTVGGKDKGVKHKNPASGTHAEGQYNKRDDDSTMHPSSVDE